MQTSSKFGRKAQDSLIFSTTIPPAIDSETLIFEKVSILILLAVYEGSLLPSPFKTSKKVGSEPFLRLDMANAKTIIPYPGSCPKNPPSNL